MNASLRVSDTPLNLISAKPVPIASGITIHELFLSQSNEYSEPVDHVHCFIGSAEIDPSDWKQRVIMDGDSVIVCPRAQGVDPFTILVIAVVSLAAISMMSIPTIDQPGEIPKPSDSYDINAQGNRAKLGDPIPTRYGKFRIYPDYAATPYREFENDDQYLYQLFSIGHGEYDYADLKIGDTAIGNFSDVSYAFYSPGQKVTLFRDAVYVSTDVTDSELKAPNDGGGWVGPFVANEAGTTIEEVAIDVVFPQGLHLANEEGGLSSLAVNLEFQYREIDDFGAPVGVWTPLASPTYTNATVDAIRRTVKVSVSVPSGRVEVRGKRTTDFVDNHRYRDEVHWTGLKGYLESGNTYSHSTWAVKVKATDQISSQNDRKFNLVSTRKLPIWNGSSWDAITATRNPAWAFCDAIKAEYGGGYADANLNLTEIKAVADIWETRGDYYDGQFDRKGTLWARLLQICLVGRAYPYQYAETFTIIRDGVNSGASYLFNGRNTVADSMQITYQTADEFADDSVEIEYTDPVTWQKEAILAAVPGSPANNPKKIKWPFVTNRVQAHREAMFMAAKQEFRNLHATFKTELDGRVLDYLTPIMVVHDLPRWGTGGEVLAVSGNTLTLSEPVVFDGAGDHHIYFRNDSGQLSSPFVVTAGGNEYEVIAAGTLPTIYTGESKTRTFFAFSSSVSTPRQMLVEKVQARGEYETTVGCVVDDPIVHSYDALIDAGTIPTPDPVPPTPVEQFKISNLVAIQGGTLTNPELQLSWSPASNAQRYLIDVSYDVGVSWTRAATVLNNHAIIDVFFGVVDIRVAPQNDEIGLWFQIQVDVGSNYAVPPTPTGLSLTSPFDGIQVLVDWDNHVNAVAWKVEIVDLQASVRHTETVTSNSFSYSHAQAELQGVGREFDVQVFAINANGVSSVLPAILRVKNEQSVAVTGLTATGVVDQVILTWNAVAEPDNVAYRVYGSNVESPGGGQPLIDGNVTSLTFAHKVPVGEQWWFTVAAFDAWGTDEINQAAQVTATTSKIISTQISDDAIQTPHLAANVVTAAKMLVTQLSAITANLGTVTAGLFKTTTGTGARVELDSSGDYPFWIGNGSKSSANGEVYYDKTTQNFTFQDPVSGMKFEIDPGNVLPFWFGAGTKNESNARLYIDDNGNIVAKGLEIRDEFDAVVFSSGGTLNYEQIDNVPVSRLYGNLLNLDDWVVGDSGTQGQFLLSGLESENSVVLEVGPDGISQPIWRAVSSGDGGSEGGWINVLYPQDGYDHTRTYRSVVWVNQVQVDGRIYYGCSATDGCTEALDGVENTNPYFWNGDLPSQNKWYLLVGIIFGSGHTDTNQSGISGVYDPDTGQRVIAGTDFRSQVGATNQVHRAFQWNAAAAGAVAFFAKPRFEEVTGDEVSISSMLANNTASNIAAGIAGQGALATQDDVAYSAVTGTKPPIDADNTASNTAAGIAGQGSFATLSQINASNVSTFIANAAIKNAQIGDAEVNTLKIAGHSVVIDESAFIATGPTWSHTNWQTLISKSITLTDTLSTSAVIVLFTGNFFMNDSDNGFVSGTVRILRNSTQIYIGSFSEFDPTTKTIMMSHNPGSGTGTYHVQVNADGTNYGGFSNNLSLVLSAGKR